MTNGLNNDINRVSPYTTIEPINSPHPLDLEKQQSLTTFDDLLQHADKERKMRDEIIEKTAFVRINGSDIGLANAANQPLDLLFGIIDGEIRYGISQTDLRPVPRSWILQATITATIAAAALLSYKLSQEGIITTALISSFNGFILSALYKVPYVPSPIGPLAGIAMLFVVKQFTGSTLLAEFALITLLALTAMNFKRVGKALAIGGWMGAKPQLIPIGCSMSGERAHRKLAEIEIPPASDPLPLPVKIILSDFDGDVFWAAKIGDKEFDPVKMASKLDEDDDDDDDEEKVEKIKTKEKPSQMMQNIKEGVVVAGSVAATMTSLYYTGQGVTTQSLNSIASASLKAKGRQQAIVNAYGILVLGATVAVVVKVLTDDSTIGGIVATGLIVLFLNTMISMANKDVKDRIITGKRPKNDQVVAIPRHVRKILGLKPNQLFIEASPFHRVLEENNNVKFTLVQKINEKSFKIAFKVKDGKLTAAYKGITKKEQKELGLSRIKIEKLGAWAQCTFLASSVALTLLSSYLTKQVQLSTVQEDTRIKSEDLGEGVVTKQMNTIFTTSAKQTAADIPPIPFHSLLFLAGGAVVLERYLKDTDQLPFLFSFVFTSAYTAMVQKSVKRFINGKTGGSETLLLPKSWWEFLESKGLLPGAQRNQNPVIEMTPVLQIEDSSSG